VPQTGQLRYNTGLHYVANSASTPRLRFTHSYPTLASAQPITTYAPETPDRLSNDRSVQNTLSIEV
jgi:hypothetical protein